MALEIYIPPCVSTPANPLHLPSPEEPLRIQIEGSLESLQKLLPDAQWPTEGEPSAFPRPAGPKLAKLAFETIYGREPRPDVVGDFVIRDEYLGWVVEQTSLRKLNDYGVTFDHLVPVEDRSPNILQIIIIEIDPAEYEGRKLLAVPRCCRNVPGTQDCEWVNRSVAQRDRGVSKSKEILSAVMDSFNRSAQHVHHRRETEKSQDQENPSTSSRGVEDLNMDKLTIQDLSDYLGRRARILNDASKDKFHYGEPMPRGSIRFLQLHPGSDDDPMVCSLIVGSLESMPFEAVSYVWGIEDNPYSITCNWATPSMDDEGFKVACPTEVTNNMTVTKNLYQLLLRIRNPADMRILWIDQICIDQDKNPAKLEEKMNQVKNMAEVYSAAKNVLIWLGEEDDETATAFGMMKWLEATSKIPGSEIGALIYYLISTADFSENEAEDPVEYKQKMEFLKDLLVHVQPTLVTGMEDPAFPNREHMTLLGSRAFNKLLERPWFTRSWTFQETISARSATIMCGSHTVHWNALYQACRSIQTRQIEIGGINERNNLAFVVESVVKKGDLQRDWSRMKRITTGNWTATTSDDHTWISGAFLDQRRIKRLLPILRHTACKDPRDKVLALLGISHDDNRWIEYPDYKWPVVNLFTSVVSYWVWGVDKMDISFLNHVQDSNPEHKLPSWTPDWSTPTIAAPLIDVAEFSASGGTVPNVFMDRIDYLGDLKPFPYFPPLAIEGYCILKVQEVDDDLGNYEHHAQMINRFKDPYPRTQLSYPEAYSKTVHPKIPDDFRPLETAEGAPSFWEYTNNLKSSSPEDAVNSTPQEYTVRDLQSYFPDCSNPDDTHSQIQHHTRASAPGRAFFVSTTGFMGLCPRNTVPGDDIYIFLGGATPFVIRGANSEDGIVRFVGECFVLGIMHGETLEGRSKQRTLVVLR